MLRRLEKSDAVRLMRIVAAPVTLSVDLLVMSPTTPPHAGHNQVSKTSIFSPPGLGPLDMPGQADTAQSQFISA